jgi:prevent-host-death family protein
MEAVRSIGLRELKEHTGRVVRDVSTSGEPIDITNHGKTIARIVPAADQKGKLSPEEWWNLMQEAGKEISDGWPEGLSAVDAIAEDRRG